MELKIEYVPIDSIEVYAHNAKLHPAEQIEQIKKSITEFGMNDPIGVWHNTIVEGHGRYIACHELGIKEVPIIRLDHLSNEERRAYGVVHNSLTMSTGFNLELLEAELEKIVDMDMSKYDFQKLDEIERQLDDFFADGSEEKQSGLEQNYKIVRFTIRVEETNRNTVLSYLDEMGYEYAEA